ncbi:MAG: energy transducer TonB [Paludibacteraceae bacterium]|nr:energy transducer TonB [Paludibacteraceae bacterium]
MVSKKSPQANLENKKVIPMMMGLVMVLSLLFIAFEWSQNEFSKHDNFATTFTPNDEDLPPITMPDKPLPPPPPPPPVSDIIEVKENDVRTVNNKIITDETPVEPLKELINRPVGNTGQEDDPEVVFITAEENPEFKGDVFTYLSKSLKYPIIPQENGVQGKVICQFVVNRDGSITDIEVVRGVDKYLDAEAVRVIKTMPAWKPGKMNGKPVRVKFTLPVVFRLM